MLLSDPKVKAVLFNIFGGITRCDEVAEGLLDGVRAARHRRCPFVVRLDGTNDEEGRAIIAERAPRERASWRRRCSSRGRDEPSQLAKEAAA